MASSSRKLHVLMLPWSAFGHMIPFFQLSVALARAGVHVSYVSTPRNILRLPKPPSDVVHLLKMVEIPLPRVDQNLLPLDAEATIDLPFEKIQYLKVAYDLLQHPIKQFIARESPDWIMVDFINDWAVDIAKDFNVSLAMFAPFCAVFYCFVGNPDFLAGDGQKRFRASPESLTSPPHWINIPTSIAYRDFESIPTHVGFYGRNASGKFDAQRLATVISGCQLTAFRSCREFEGEYLDLCQRLYKKPVIPVGFLLPEKPQKEEKMDNHPRDSSWNNIFDWLNMQKPKSVVYVGFGSECKLTKEQVNEIAKGLELSKLPFFWALRKPGWANHEDEALPPGFLERTSPFGLVSIGWVPQMDILAHPSIGGSLFHSGWGSIIETLQFGHCLIVLPLIIDQPLNARFLVEKGLAVEIERGEDGSFSGESIAKALNLAMVSKGGEKLRVHAREMAAIFGDEKLHQDYVGKFVEYLEQSVDILK